MEKLHLLSVSVGLFVASAQTIPAVAVSVSGSTLASQTTTTPILSTHSLVAGSLSEIATTAPSSSLELAEVESLYSSVALESKTNEPASVSIPLAKSKFLPNTQSPSFFDNLVAQGVPVTSVSQLSDVQPTDWAFQALQSLVERYGCIAGYPDSNYLGNRALTRSEFAAGLNACLDRVNELIATASAEGVTTEDLATLQMLQSEFTTELATLRGRVDALEAAEAELEANQFSTTTKLNGEVIFATSGAFGNKKAVPSGVPASSASDVDENLTLSDRAILNFESSFTGEDSLIVSIYANNNPDFLSATGTSMARLVYEQDSAGSQG